MDIKKILIGSAIYIVLAILIGYFVSNFAIYAAAIAALIAGIYMGRMALSSMKAIFNGFVVGLVGGIIGGLLSTYLPTFGGVSLAIDMSGWLNYMLASFFAAAVPWLAIPSMAIVGFIWAAIGGFVGFKYLHKK